MADEVKVGVAKATVVVWGGTRPDDLALELPEDVSRKLRPNYEQVGNLTFREKVRHGTGVSVAQGLGIPLERIEIIDAAPKQPPPLFSRKADRKDKP